MANRTVIWSGFGCMMLGAFLAFFLLMMPTFHGMHTPWGTIGVVDYPYARSMTYVGEILGGVGLLLVIFGATIPEPEVKVPPPVFRYSSESGQRFCQYCGEAIPSDALYCHRCGKKTEISR